MGKKKRDRNAEKAAKFKRAFDEIIGNPYSKPDPTEGHYSMLKSRSSLAIAEPERKAKTPVNEARPSAIDFFIDVDAAVADGLDVFGRTWREPDQVDFIFQSTYFTEDQKYYHFTQQERAEVEQAIGQLLVYRGISPAAKYFTAIRQ